MPEIIKKIKNRLSLMFGLDLRSLALARILMAILILSDLAQRATSLVAHYTDDGVLPRIALISPNHDPWFISIHLIGGSWQIEALLFLIAAIFAVLLLVGYKTKMVTVFSWFFLFSLNNRNPLIIQSSDILMVTVLFLAIFLPWGEYYSIDAVKKLSDHPDEEKKGPWYFSAATFAYILQICFVYWFSALFKVIKSPQWLDGTAVYQTLSSEIHTSHLGYLLLSFPGFLKIMTFSVFLIELLGPFLFFMPFFTQGFRILIILLFSSMHLGIAATMNVGNFPFVDIMTLSALLPALFWKKLEKLVHEANGELSDIYYDGDCGFCKKAINFFRIFFILPYVRIQSASTNPSVAQDMARVNSWVIVDKNGNHHFKTDGLQKLVAASPIFFIFSPIFNFASVKIVGDSVYDIVANHRVKVCYSINSPQTNKAPLKIKKIAKIAINILILLMIAYVFWSNVAALLPSFSMPQWLQGIGSIPYLSQSWQMFSGVFLYKNWFVMPGLLSNGQTVDVFQGGKQISFIKPQSISDMFSDERWRKFSFGFNDPSFSPYFPFYAQYICNNWNKNHLAQEQLMSFDVISIYEKILQDQSAPDYKNIWHQDCFK